MAVTSAAGLVSLPPVEKPQNLISTIQLLTVSGRGGGQPQCCNLEEVGVNLARLAA